MDNLEIAVVDNSPTNKKVNKRRSSVFKRQSITFKDQDFENVDITEKINQESKKSKFEDNKLKSFDIAKYIESLNEEDKKWREQYARRKSRVQDLIKHDKNQEQIKQSLDITFLSDSERAFLKLKPDYKEFHKNVFQLHAMATKVTFLNLCANNFYENSILKLQEDTNNAVHRIINLTD